MKVRDIMTRDVKVIKHTESVKVFLRNLEEIGISGMPVVDSDGQILGVATMTDVGKGVSDPPIATEVDREFYGDAGVANLDSARVEDIMTEHVVTVGPQKPLYELASLMAESGIHRVFVVDGEEIVGVVTSLDMVRVFGDQLTKQAASVG